MDQQIRPNYEEILRLKENATNGTMDSPFRIKPFSVWQKKIDEILEIQAQRQYEASLTDPVLDTTTNPNPNDTTTPDTTTPINL